jgi:hypothetical protein
MSLNQIQIVPPSNLISLEALLRSLNVDQVIDKLRGLSSLSSLLYLGVSQIAKILPYVIISAKSSDFLQLLMSFHHTSKAFPISSARAKPAVGTVQLSWYCGFCEAKWTAKPSKERPDGGS